MPIEIGLTFWSGCSWLIVNFQFREEFLRGFNCFCVSHSHVYLHEKQQLLGRRSPSLLSHKVIGISFLFIYLSFSFIQIDSLLGSEWECWHTFHPVCCLLLLISLTPGFLFPYQSENKFKFASEWSSVSRFNMFFISPVIPQNLNYWDWKIGEKFDFGDKRSLSRLSIL